MNKAATAETGKTDLRQRVGFWLGPALALGLQLLGPPDSLTTLLETPDAARGAWVVLSLLSLMAVWWVTEAIPIPVTSLLPLVILPVFGVQAIGAVSAAYMHPIVVLLLGGFIIARAIERWNLHERIALSIVVRAGARPSLMIAGFMAAAALLSMWISNTATSIMMMPIAISVAASLSNRDDGASPPFLLALLIGIAWACSIGGLGTPVGTPTNLIIIGYLNQTAGYQIGFLSWIAIGLPTVLVLVPLGWLVLTRWAFRPKLENAAAGQAYVRERLTGLGPVTTPEWRTLCLFAVIAGLWIFRRPLNGLEIMGVTPLAGLTDHVIAILGVILFFLVPSGTDRKSRGALLDWPTAEAIPWGVLLLFGGGMALAGAITASGLGTWLGGELAILASLPVVLIILAVTLFVIFLTEVTSNIATASALMPVLGALALSTGLDITFLAIPLALAASCAFMLPMATGPNAVVFATGRVSLPQMARAGLRMNIVATGAITAIAYWLGPLVF